MAEGGPGSTGDVVAALCAVDGVADASITPDRRLGGAGTLHLSLMPGADEVAVATAVNRILRDHFGLAVDTDNVSVVDETSPTRLSSVPDASGSPLFAPGAYPAAASGPSDSSVGGRPFTGWPRDPGPVDDVEELVDLDEVGPLDDVEDESYAPLAVVPPLTAVPPLVEADQADRADGRPALSQHDDHARPPVPEGPSPRGPRLLIERMQLVAADLGIETEVTLGFGEDRWTGHADGAATPSSVHRSVAAATLRAVEQCVGGAMRLELEHLETPPLGNQRAVIVEISLVTRRGAERLTGVSTIRDDARQAVVRATLDALNRRLESYLVPA
ncbi:MAG TPA: hypothetical protein VEV13_03230 [Candidatus Limnocylindria bacterium]|nr:hypothetical protein [Candidatus Limnocylindria bacterium]